MFTARDICKVKAAANNLPLSTSKANRQSRCNFLRKIAKVKKPVKCPVLSKANQNKRIQWAKNHMKCDFSKVIFTDECRASVDGPDGWSQRWVLHGRRLQCDLKDNKKVEE